MPEYLPLYPDDHRLAIERSRPLDAEAAHRTCKRCPLHSRGMTTCLCAEGDPGGLLLVGEVPGESEDVKGRPFVGKSGALLREAVGEMWDGPVAFDNALRCFRGYDKKDTPAKVTGYIEACRGYLHQTLKEARPSRVVALGGAAAQAILGHSVPPLSVRRGYAFLSDGTPVFLGVNPAAALRNRFVKKWFLEDLRWALTCEIPFPPWDAEARIVCAPEDARQACAELRETRFAYDTETAGKPYDSFFEVLCLAACSVGSDYPWVWDRAALLDPALRDELFDLLEDDQVPVVGHNLKYDMLVMAADFGITVQGAWMDTQHVRRLNQADAAAKLETCSHLVGMGGLKDESKHHIAIASETISKARARAARVNNRQPSLPGLASPLLDAAVRLSALEPKAFAYGLIPRAVRLRRCALDAMATARLVERELPELERRPRIHMLWKKVAQPAVEAFTQIERWGMPASVQAMGLFNEYLVAKAKKLRRKLTRYGDFNPDSPADVARVMFDELGLRVLARSDKTDQPSTAKTVLQQLKHPIAADILEYRRIAKLLGTYSDGLAVHVRADGRVHPNIKLDGTETGRPSCADPSLQNLPRAHTEEGKMSRDCFSAPPGYVFLEADYSQIEIRVAAMLSGDKRMITSFKNGEDIHLRTAHLISRPAWNIEPAAVTSKERTESKVTTFGLFYGKGDATLARDLGITIEQAGVIRAEVLGIYTDFNAWCDNQLVEVMRTGEVWTWWDGSFARCRPLYRVANPVEEDQEKNRARQTALNSRINTPIQGTAAEYCTASAIETVDAILRGWIPAQLMITVHDALMMLCREDDVEEVVSKTSDIMLQWPTLNDVPLAVDFKVGRSWGSMEKWKPCAESALVQPRSEWTHAHSN